MSTKVKGVASQTDAVSLQVMPTEAVLERAERNPMTVPIVTLEDMANIWTRYMQEFSASTIYDTKECSPDIRISISRRFGLPRFGRGFRGKITKYISKGRWRAGYQASTWSHIICAPGAAR